MTLLIFTIVPVKLEFADEKRIMPKLYQAIFLSSAVTLLQSTISLAQSDPNSIPTAPSPGTPALPPSVSASATAPSAIPSPVPTTPAAPNYPASPQTPPAPTSTLGGLLQDLKGLVKDFVQVDLKDAQGQPKVHVKAPFVDVDVQDGKPFHVKAPLVDINKTPNGPTSVKAPLTNINKGDKTFKAPLTKVQQTPNGVKVDVPFVHVGGTPKATDPAPSN